MKLFQGVRKPQTYKISISMLFGILSFFLNIHPLNINLRPFDIPLYPGLFFPVYIAIVWGLKYGLVSAFSGGYLSILLFRHGTDYGLVYFFTFYILWVLWHGLGEKFSRETGNTIWTDMIILELLYRFVVILSAFTLFPVLISLKSALGDGTIHIQPISSVEIGYHILIQSVFGLFSILFFRVALTNSQVRRFFYLKPLPWKRHVNIFFPGLIFLILLHWIISALIRYVMIYSGTIPFANILFYRIYNQSLIQDMVPVYILTLSLIYLEYTIRKLHLQWDSAFADVHKKFRKQDQLVKIHEKSFRLFNDLPDIPHPDKVLDRICQDLKQFMELKNFWIIRLSPEKKYTFIHPGTEKERDDIVRFLNSSDGQTHLHKLKRSRDIAVVPAVAIHRKELFPDIYHVLISTWLSLQSGEYLIAFIVEEELAVSELFSNMLRLLSMLLVRLFENKENEKSAAGIPGKQPLKQILKAHYAHLPGYWIICNTSYHIRMASEDFLSFSGYSRADITGHDLRRILNIPEKIESSGGPDTPVSGFLVRQNGSQTPILMTRIPLGSKTNPDWLIYLADNLSTYLKMKAYEDREFRYRSYFNNMSDASFVIDRTTRILDVNQAACSLFKYQRNEMIGLKISDIVTDDEISKIDLHIQTILKNQVARFESTHVTKNGHRIAAEVHARRFSERNHELIHVVIRNISERKEQEETLMQFYETIKAIGDVGGMLLLSFNEQGNIRYANTRAMEIYGYDMSHLRERFFYSTFISPDRQKDAQSFLEYLALGEQKQGQKIYPFSAKDGSEKMFLWDFSHIRREKKYNLFFAIGIDVTSYYKEFDEIRRERDDYMLWLEKSPLPCLVTDHKGTILKVNASLSGLLEKPYHELKYQFLDVCMDADAYHDLYSQISEHSEHTILGRKGILTGAEHRKIPVILFMSVPDSHIVLLYAIPENNIT
ncbi:MAG: PAS domain-containing protein [Fidelibacterota bacterium]